MIAFPPQKRPSIREMAEAFKAHMATIAPPEVREPITCPYCGRELGSFIGRRTGRNIVLHFECGGRCRRQFVSGYGDTPAEALRAFEENSWERSGMPTIDVAGDTREEAISEFKRFAAPVGFHSDQGRSLPDTQKKAATVAAIPPTKEPLQLLLVSGGIPSESPELHKKNEAAVPFSESEVKSCQSHVIASAIPTGSKPAPKVRPSGAATFQTLSATVPPEAGATFQGMAFSVEGLSEEAVNSLLTMKEEG